MQEYTTHIPLISANWLNHSLHTFTFKGMVFGYCLSVFGTDVLTKFNGLGVFKCVHIGVLCLLGILSPLSVPRSVGGSSGLLNLGLGTLKLGRVEQYRVGGGARCRVRLKHTDRHYINITNITNTVVALAYLHTNIGMPTKCRTR